MTTPTETVTLIQYLRDHWFIGETCWVEEEETLRDHLGFDCPIEAAEYDAWEWSLHAGRVSLQVDLTYRQIRRLAREYWRALYHDMDADAVWECYYAATQTPEYQARAEELAYDSLRFNLDHDPGQVVPPGGAAR